jgi:glycosyltransferase involved in cell wall biosynthesis
MVAFHYPPSGAVAAQRPHKFARYLPESGWEPLIVARRPDPRQPFDPSFEGPPAPRCRLSPLEPARFLGVLPPAWADSLRRGLFVPDEDIGWMASLMRSLPSLVARWRPDVLWANSVPTGSLVAAAWAARRARVPFVADFHNEWTRNMYYRPATVLHDRAHRRLEDWVVRSARAVVTLNPLHTEDLRARYPGIDFETIENGFDPGEASAGASGAGLVFTYAGSIYGHQGPAPFLRALAGTGRRDVSVRVVGDRFGGVRPSDWPFPVAVQGHVRHRELARAFRGTSAFFLCLETPAARQLPAKLYEYLGAGRPTFAIVPRGGAVERWIRETGAGRAVPFEEPSNWTPALERFIEEIPDFRAPDGSAFHRRFLAGKLAGLLDRAAGRP